MLKDGMVNSLKELIDYAKLDWVNYDDVYYMGLTSKCVDFNLVNDDIEIIFTKHNIAEYGTEFGISLNYLIPEYLEQLKCYAINRVGELLEEF